MTSTDVLQLNQQGDHVKVDLSKVPQLQSVERIGTIDLRG